METSAIEKLLQIKKKSEASKADKYRFQNEWLSYVKKNGYNETAERYMIDGFSFLGIVPFFTYLIDSENKYELIVKFLSGRNFNKNKSIAFKATLHILALLIKELPDEKTLILLIIKCLPNLSINKDGKCLGDLSKSVDKYFLKVLSSSIEFSNFDFHDLPLEAIESFRKMMIEAFGTIIKDRNCSPEELSKMAKIEKWISKEDEMSIKTDKSKVATESYHETAVVVHQEIPGNVSVQCNDYMATYKRDSNTWHDHINSIIAAINQLEKEVTHLQINYEKFLSESTKLKTDLDKAQYELYHERENCERLKKENSDLSEKLSSFRKHVDDLKTEIKSKNKEIEERIKFAEMLSRDRDKLSEELLKRIGSKLRVEYRDFLDAESLPMNEDLGENMRLQLKSVFEILKKNGLILE